MKKLISFNLIIALLLLCGCNDKKENSDTRFMLDTVVKITAECDEKTLDGAFAVCKNYENKLSRTIASSEVSKINSSSDAAEVSDDTLRIIKRSLYYSEITNGKFDITICPVSRLWDFNSDIIPNRNEIAEALKNVDYESLETKGNFVNTHGKQIDLGAVAKGFISDKLKEYLISKGAKNGVIDLGGNITVFGRECEVGIRKPYASDEISAIIKLKNASAVTSGIYQRYIEKDGKKYHHILDPKTGYGVETDLVSATVIGKNSLDCDAAASCSILLGKDKGMEFIENSPDLEAVFIDENGSMSLSSGLKSDGEFIRVK